MRTCDMPADDQLRTLFFSSAPSDARDASNRFGAAGVTIDAAARQLLKDQQVPTKEMAALLHIRRLQPHDDGMHYDLARLAVHSQAPSDSQAVLLEQALALRPAAVDLKFALSNVRKQQFTELNSVVPSSEGSPHANALSHAKERWLNSLREIVIIDEGRYSPTVQQNLGTVLQLMGSFAESEISFLAMLELLGLSLETGRASRELTQAEQRDVKTALAALDLSLAHQGKDRSPGHLLGVNIGFWERADQRSPTNRPGLFACPFYKKDRYGLVRKIEAAATAMRTEMMALLRRRANGDAAEAARWYVDNERIATVPSHWLRRHVACEPDTFEAHPKTCKAVYRAMSWYFSAAPGGTDAEIDAFYLKAQFSLLAPRAHIVPHVGPTNERLAISVGLAGLGEAEIRVGDTWRRWVAGEAILFDDSFEHEVRNIEAEHPRAVLIVHFPHPQLMPPGTNGARIAEEIASTCDVEDHVNGEV